MKSTSFALILCLLSAEGISLAQNSAVLPPSSAVAPPTADAVKQLLSGISDSTNNALEIKTYYAPLQPNQNWREVVTYISLPDLSKIRKTQMELLDTSKVTDITRLAGVSAMHVNDQMVTPTATYWYSSKGNQWLPALQFPGQEQPVNDNQFNALLVREAAVAFPSTNSMLQIAIHIYKDRLKRLDINKHPDRVAETLDKLRALTSSPVNVAHVLSDSDGSVQRIFNISANGMITEAKLASGGRPVFDTQISLIKGDEFPSQLPLAAPNAVDVNSMEKSLTNADLQKLSGKKSYGIQLGIHQGQFFVLNVLPGGAADKAGLKFPDIISKINGLSLAGMNLDDARHLCDRDHVIFTIKSADGKEQDIALDRALVK